MAIFHIMLCEHIKKTHKILRKEVRKEEKNGIN